MNRGNKIPPEDELNGEDMNHGLNEIYSCKIRSLIERFKKRSVWGTQSIDNQIKKDMAFWIKHRPSRWSSFIPNRLEKTFLQLINNKYSKQFVIYTAFIFCLIFVGFVPTLKLLFWYLFKIGLICILIPFSYWVIAISAIYSKVIAIKLIEVILTTFDMLFDRKF